MKSKMIWNICILILALFVLAGCAGKEIPEPTTVTVETNPPATSASTTPVEETESASSVVRASTTEDLLEAIGPGAEIVLEPGYYNMSVYLEEVWAQEGEGWNARHPYVQLAECYDGVELVIQNVEGLMIYGCGESPADTEIVTEPRYGAVMNFERCSGISLFGMTMGHTEIGECSGNVLNFYGCRNIDLSAMDLYGCGVYGIGCFEGTGDVYVYSTDIRDCSAGPLAIMDGAGRFEFYNCSLINSDGFAWYEKTPESDLAFYECLFGDNETSCFMFEEDVYTEDCVWSENYIYPEYGYGEEAVYDPENIAEAAVEHEDLTDTYWTGYVMVNPESGEEVYLPYEDLDGSWVGILVMLNADGTGSYEYGAEYHSITWTWEDAYSVLLQNEDGWYYYMTPYTMGDRLWLLLEEDGCLIWCY